MNKTIEVIQAIVAIISIALGLLGLSGVLDFERMFGKPTLLGMVFAVPFLMLQSWLLGWAMAMAWGGKQ